MNQPKASPLFKAVNKNDIATLQKLLAGGEPVDPQDHERMTPVMRAARAGNMEAFHLLVNAGANLNAVGMSQTDVLEMAASGGNVEIIRFLIDKGASLEGHWEPRSDALRRMGHMTPLICAAIGGNVDAVRVLLDAGANREAKFDGETALKIIKDEIKFPLYAKNYEEKEHYKAIAVLLTAKASDSSSGEDTSAAEVAKFADNATKPGYLRVRQLLQDRCEQSCPWKPVPDHGMAAKEVVHFILEHDTTQSELNDLFDQAQAAQCYLVLAEPRVPEEDLKLVLFPTNDKFAVIATIGTEGANHGVNTAEIIAWLREMDKENPFVLRYCSHEMVGGDFLKALKGVKKVAEKIVEICPNVLDEDMETVQALANAIKKQKSFLVWWD